MGSDDGAWRAAAENGWGASHSGVAEFPLDPIDRLVVCAYGLTFTYPEDSVYKPNKSTLGCIADKFESM
jgi:hypothetical protein